MDRQINHALEVLVLTSQFPDEARALARQVREYIHKLENTLPQLGEEDEQETWTSPSRREGHDPGEESIQSGRWSDRDGG